MTAQFNFDSIDRWVVGTIGEPGRRLFLIQVTSGAETVTIKTEKERVMALSTLLAQVLEGVDHFGHLPDDMELSGPLDIAFTSSGWSVEHVDDTDRYEVEITGYSPDEELREDLGEDDEDSYVRFGATQEQLASIAISGRALVEAGRPPCPLCNFPMGPDGHACPRSNGNRPPQT